VIPSDVVSALRLQQPDVTKLSANQAQNQPVATAQRVADVLSDLVPGQRILAEVQALLPNGTYRAIVAQRDITLALPFSAKPGDTLELEVTESDGKLTLAFVANRSSATNSSSPESVSTSLSTAGKVIGNLLTPLEGEGKQAAPAALNRSQPLVETMPKTGADLAPVLKQALSQSGMFYEAHQARWVSGQLPTTALLQEPQGKLSPAPLNAPEFVNRSSSFNLGGVNENISSDAQLRHSVTAPPSTNIDALAQLPAKESIDKSPGQIVDTTINQKSVSTTNENPVARELVPLVQQQLNGLATQNFVWQGQIWPGQPMWWEISGDPESKPSQENEQASQWQTRLKLDLPALGGVDVTLRLGAGGALAVSASASKPASEALLRENSQALREQLSAAGLTLTQLRVDHGQAGE
jgi:hypothetical protein